MCLGYSQTGYQVVCGANWAVSCSVEWLWFDVENASITHQIDTGNAAFPKAQTTSSDTDSAEIEAQSHRHGGSGSVPETKKANPKVGLTRFFNWLPDLGSNQGPAD